MAYINHYSHVREPDMQRCDASPLAIPTNATGAGSTPQPQGVGPESNPAVDGVPATGVGKGDSKEVSPVQMMHALLLRCKLYQTALYSLLRPSLKLLVSAVCKILPTASIIMCTAYSKQSTQRHQL